MYSIRKLFYDSFKAELLHALSTHRRIFFRSGRAIRSRNSDYIGVLVLLYLTLGMFLFSSCRSGLTYQPDEIIAFRQTENGVVLRYDTRAGNQTCFYIPPEDNPLEVPLRLVLFYPGIRSRALDWLDVVDHSYDSSTASLLIDYPGRGKNQGIMRPKYLHESSYGAIEALAGYLHLEPKGLLDRVDLILCGYSFGGGAALQFATLEPTKRIVLIATFTTMHQVLFRRIGPLAWLIPDRLDNMACVRELSRQHPRPKLTVIHGDQDGTVPVEMGRKLASLFPEWVAYHEIKGSDHTQIILKSKTIIKKALYAPGKEVPL